MPDNFEFFRLFIHPCYQLINYIKTFYTGYFVPGRNKWIKPRFHPRFWYVIGSIIA